MSGIDDHFDGLLDLKLDRVLSMETDQKFTSNGMISRFNWVLGAFKHNILNEEHLPKPTLLIYAHCNERGKRLDGWSCTSRIRFVVESERKSQQYFFDNAHFPMTSYRAVPPPSSPGCVLTLANGTIGIELPWDNLIQDFHLSGDKDWLNISVKINVLEQTGYGSLIQLDARFRIHDKIIFFNKYHLATYSSYFRTLFFSNWAQRDVDEYDLTSSGDDLEAFQQMLAMSYPVDNFPEPSISKISDILRLADKYDLPIVTERCERLLIHGFSGDDGNALPCSSNNANSVCNSCNYIPMLITSNLINIGNIGQNNNNNHTQLHTHSYQHNHPNLNQNNNNIEQHFSLIQKLALAERYQLYNLKTHCLDKMSPAHFCAELRANIEVYNRELSEGLKAELDEKMSAKCTEELTSFQQRQENAQNEGHLPPPHKRVRPRPKTPPRPNYNLPPFRFK
uniref:BTB domain-containing protein n=1 Tax=Meloidogyne floridensis TaxID=298350 RepID=A0A915P627_9BILA